jgi:copper transporter 1
MFFQAYLIAAVVIGATLGHYIYGSQIEADAILAGAADTQGIGCC